MTVASLIHFTGKSVGQNEVLVANISKRHAIVSLRNTKNDFRKAVFQ